MVALLESAGVGLLVDVRTAPGSRRWWPHVARAELAHWLPEQEIGYRHDKRLGELRAPPSNPADTALRHSGLAGYAAHLQTREVAAAMGVSIRLGVIHSTLLPQSLTVKMGSALPDGLT